MSPPSPQVKLVEDVDKIMRTTSPAYCQSLPLRAPDVALYLGAVETRIDLRGIVPEFEHVAKRPRISN